MKRTNLPQSQAVSSTSTGQEAKYPVLGLMALRAALHDGDGRYGTSP